MAWVSALADAFDLFRLGILMTSAHSFNNTAVLRETRQSRRLTLQAAADQIGPQGQRLIVVGDGEVDDDLVRDMIEVLTSMWARLNGRSGARNRALRAVTCAKREPVA